MKAYIVRLSSSHIDISLRPTSHAPVHTWLSVGFATGHILFFLYLRSFSFLGVSQSDGGGDTRLEELEKLFAIINLQTDGTVPYFS